MNKRGWILWVSIILVVVFLIVLFFYWALYNPKNGGSYASNEVVNPSTDLSLEQAIAVFDERFVFYILFSIKSYNLHNPPLSSDTPKIEFYIDNDVYRAEIVKGAINVEKGDIADEDIIIRTTKEEAVKMTQDKKYITQSFNSGKSTIELISGKTELFSKGYLSMYTELTGKSIVGNVIRIYAG